MVSLFSERKIFGKFFKKDKLSLLFAVIFIIAVLVTIFFGSIFYGGTVKEGEISLRTVYAPYDFKYPWGLNEEKTQELQQKVSCAVAPVYIIDNNVESDEENRLSIFIDEIKQLQSQESVQLTREQIDNAKSKISMHTPDKSVTYFVGLNNQRLNLLKSKILDAIRSVYPVGIVTSDKKDELVNSSKFVEIRNPGLKTSKIRDPKKMLTVDDAKKVAKEYLDRNLPNEYKIKNYSADIVSSLIQSNMNYDEPESQKAIEEAIKRTNPVYDMVEIKKNELIVGKGQRITEQNISQLKELGVVGGVTQKKPYAIGMTLLLFILMACGVFYLTLIDKKLIANPKEIGIILFVSFILIVISQIIVQSRQSDYLIPIAGSSILIALLVSSNAALLNTVILSMILGIISGGKIEVAIVLFASGFIATYLVKDARRRSSIIIACLASGVVSFFTITAIGFLNNLDFNVILNEGLWGVGGGIVSVFIVLGLLPIMEYIFKQTTNITLLELSDLNHPLLKELTLKAPGTYQHSIAVGNLAESACDAIGANSLLARVGSYYHDIGKIEKAEYFSENEMGAKSKHEKLTPSMSALIIINHVKDGVEMAKKYKINPKIMDFIAQHHGTSLIYYFYQRALEKVNDEDALKEEDFRYPGPKPQTKETAIVHLADSVEASSRALSDPTPARIMGLVQKITNNKFIDNQLDNCDLTLKDLNKIAASFVRVLTATFHTRLEYPDKKQPETKKTGKNKSKKK